MWVFVEQVQYVLSVAPEVVWQVWRPHTNLKFGMAVPHQSAEIWAVDFQENH